MGYQDEIHEPDEAVSNVGQHSLPVRADSTPSPIIPSTLYSNSTAGSSQYITQTPENNDCTNELKRQRSEMVSLQNSVVSIITTTMDSGVLNQQSQSNNVPSEVPSKKRLVEKDIDNLNQSRQNKQTPTLSKDSSQIIFRRKIVPREKNINFDTFEQLKIFLQSKTLKSKGNELKKCRKNYNNHEDTLCNKYTQQLEKQINKLEKEMIYCKKVQDNIIQELASTTVCKLQCKACSKQYNYKSCFITHVLDYHPEKLIENFEPADSRNRTTNSDNAATSAATSGENVFAESVDDGASTLSYNFRSPSSQITLSNDNDYLEFVSVYAPSLNDNPPNTSSLNTTSSTTLLEIVPIDRVDRCSSEKTKGISSCSNENSDTIINNIRPVIRKPINLFGSASFKLFEQESKKIKLWLKRPNKSAKIINKKKLKTNKKTSKSYNTDAVHDNALMMRYCMTVIYSKDELNQIKHCFNLNPKANFLCEDCQLNLVKYETNAYAESNEAFIEQKNIINNKLLNKKSKTVLLKELYKKDKYRLIRMRLETIREHRETFNLLPDLVRYNNKYFKMLKKSFNDKIFQECVGLKLRGNKMFELGEFCNKLMDDIANELLVNITVTCMTFAHSDKRIMLTKEHLRKYELLFVTTNKDATYFEQFPLAMAQHVKTKYGNYLPNTKNLEVIITDCLLRHCFCDKDSIHENLDNLIFEHLKSPQPIFKFLMYMKFSRPYLASLNSLLLRFLSKITIEVLKLKKNSNAGQEVTYNELIEACEIVGVFTSSYTYYLKHSYG